MKILINRRFEAYFEKIMNDRNMLIIQPANRHHLLKLSLKQRASTM